MYANNIQNLLSELWNKEEKTLGLDIEEEIQRSAIITHQGDYVNETIKSLNTEEQSE